MISPEKINELKVRMQRLSIFEKDIIEKFILSGKKGGQKANKSHNAVYLKHIPTNIEVKCNETRERELNRFLARRLLCEKVEELLFGTSERLKRIEKIRKQKAKRKKRIKLKNINNYSLNHKS
ncbi:MAG: peptide chain release factor-like protein [Candidatus Goldbacteria bacterium]|nr:peptide chain release factor-like protein [Candidatus Goldiibacteriota bacterium]